MEEIDAMIIAAPFQNITKRPAGPASGKSRTTARIDSGAGRPEPDRNLDISIGAKGTAAMSASLGLLHEYARSQAGNISIYFRNGAVTLVEGGGFLRHFAGSSMAAVLPFAAGASAGLNLLMGAREIASGLRERSSSMMACGALDIGIALAGAMSLIPPLAGAGVLCTGVFLAGRLLAGATGALNR
jgi:hypothetical protein